MERGKALSPSHLPPRAFFFFFFPAFQRHKETSMEKRVYQLQLAAVEVLLISKPALFLLDFAIVSVLYGSNFKWIFGDQNSKIVT